MNPLRCSPGVFAVFVALTAVAPHLALAQTRAAVPHAPPIARAHTPVHESGTLTHYMLSPMGRVRGFVLNANTVVFVHGRAAQTMPARAAVGALVDVEGYAVAGQRSTIHGATVRDANGHVIVAAPAARPNRSTHLTAANRTRLDRLREARRERIAQLPSVTVSGTVQTVLSDRAGNVDGVLLWDGTSIAVPRALARQIGAHGLRVGQTLRVTGHGENYPAGESVQADEVTFSDGMVIRGHA